MITNNQPPVTLTGIRRLNSIEQTANAQMGTENRVQEGRHRRFSLPGRSVIQQARRWLNQLNSRRESLNIARAAQQDLRGFDLSGRYLRTDQSPRPTAPPAPGSNQETRRTSVTSNLSLGSMEETPWPNRTKGIADLRTQLIKATEGHEQLPEGELREISEATSLADLRKNLETDRWLEPLPEMKLTLTDRAEKKEHALNREAVIEILDRLAAKIQLSSMTPKGKLPEGAEKALKQLDQLSTYLKNEHEPTDLSFEEMARLAVDLRNVKRSLPEGDIKSLTRSLHTQFLASWSQYARERATRELSYEYRDIGDVGTSRSSSKSGKIKGSIGIPGFKDLFKLSIGGAWNKYLSNDAEGHILVGQEKGISGKAGVGLGVKGVGIDASASLKVEHGLFDEYHNNEAFIHDSGYKTLAASHYEWSSPEATYYGADPKWLSKAKRILGIGTEIQKHEKNLQNAINNEQQLKEQLARTLNVGGGTTGHYLYEWSAPDGTVHKGTYPEIKSIAKSVVDVSPKAQRVLGVSEDELLKERLGKDLKVIQKPVRAKGIELFNKRLENETPLYGIYVKGSGEANASAGFSVTGGDTKQMGVSAAVRAANYYVKQYIPEQLWSVLEERPERVDELPYAVSVNSERLLRRATDKGSPERHGWTAQDREKALSLLKNEFDHYVALLKQSETSKASKETVQILERMERSWGVTTKGSEAKMDTLASMIMAHAYLGVAIHKDPDATPESKALVAEIAHSINQPDVALKQKIFDVKSKIFNEVESIIKDKEFEVTISESMLGAFSGSVAVKHRNRTHPSRFRAGDIIDLTFKGQGAVTTGVINMIAQRLGSEGLQLSADQLLEGLSGAPDLNVQAGIALQTRWMKPILQENPLFKEQTENKYRLQFTRVIGLTGVSVGGAVLAPVGVGANIGGGIGYTRGKETVLKESLYSDSLSYSLMRYNRFMRNDKDDTLRNWARYYEKHLDDFRDIFGKMADPKSTISKEIAFYIAEAIKDFDDTNGREVRDTVAEDPTPMQFKQRIEAFQNSRFDKYDESQMQTAKDLFEQLGRLQQPFWLKEHRSQWMDMSFGVVPRTHKSIPV